MRSRDISILLVSEQASRRGQLRRALLQAGYSVRWAASGWGALREMERAMPHLVVADLEMTGMRGDELLSRIGLEWSSIQRVLIAEEPQKVSFQALAHAGGLTVMSKQETMDKVLHQLDFLLRRLPVHEMRETRVEPRLSEVCVGK
ncbi:response regulator [Magnetofaba australis]|uniref:Putative response regulator receiver protein n=1 Tax=Magnetofaba australis IT-1 TaxID=1434232 RepID=A0A1Y2K113_9PROT|nr:response regulator [Magnetofaba australis]OSM01357.1 putative response regulator receiver protein [Magnetofaba australis IT-1]